MKKIYLLLLSTLFIQQNIYSQATAYVEAPIYDNSTTTGRAPNGTIGHSFMRGCALVLGTELTNLSNGSNITSFGFTLNSGTSATAVSGNFTLYLQNTTDITYQKGTTYATALTGMTSVFANVMTVPVSPGSTSITITLGTPFNYTGGGIYVAYDWASTGPFDATAAIYRCNSLGLNPGCATANSNVSAPATLSTTAFRPCFLFGVANTFTNDIQVLGIEAPGRVAGMFNTPHTIKALIKNGSVGTLNNIGVNLNVSGANSLANSISIASLASGASTLVSFSAFNPLITGLNTVSVSVASDQNNLNNSATYAQSVTCNEWAQNPAAGNFTNAVGFNAGSGIIAVTYSNPANSIITAMRGAISTNTPSVGNSVYGALLSSSGVVLATTNTITITNAMLGTFQSFTFSSPQALSASTSYYIGFAQMIGSPGYFPAGSYTVGHLPANLYSTTTLAGGVMTPLTTNLGYFGIEGIFLPNVINAAITPTSMCLGATATITSQGLASTYTWSPGGANTSSITVSPASTGIYTVNGNVPGLCSSSSTVMVTIIQPPNITAISIQTAICLGNSATLTAGGAATYTWNTGANTNTLVQSPNTTSTYSVSGTSAAGCINSNTVEVVVNSFTPGITSSTAVCEGREITLTATGGTVYNWSTNSPFASITITPAITSVLTVTATGTNGCIGNNSTTVTVNANPTVNVVAQRTVMCKGETNTLTASGASTYSWSNNATGSVSVISPTSNITFNYLVTGSNVAGCSHTAQISVKVNACTGLNEENSGNLTITIYPNPGNGLFKLSANENETGKIIRIVNILGTTVFEGVHTENEQIIDLQDQANGIYFVYLMDGKHSNFVSKLIKE
jgi:hypothetical protein